MDRVAPIKFMAEHYVYILKSEVDGKLYIGNTCNIRSRILKHNNGRVKSTKWRRPLTLVHAEKLRNRKEAMQRERYLKSLKSHKYIEEHILTSDSSVR